MRTAYRYAGDMSAESPASPDAPRRGRRPGTSGTRQAVLDAARARFAQDGYAGATIRKIAADAGVDASLVLQFFHSKDELFGAVMSITPSALTRMAEAFVGPDEGVGERVTRAFLAVWEGDPVDSEPLLAMLRGAIAHEQAAAQLREFIEARLITEVRPDVAGDPTARTRIGLAAAMLVGVVLGRRVVRVPTLVAADTEAIVALVGPALQAALTAVPGSVDASH